MGNPSTDPGNSYRAAIFEGKADSMVVLSGRSARTNRGLQPDKFRVQTGGWYRVRFSVWGCRWNQGEIEPAVRSAGCRYANTRLAETELETDEKQRWVSESLPERGVRRRRKIPRFMAMP